MSAKSGGSLATVLMSVPLAAIPLMAIFGIPQFTAVVASPDNADRNDVIGLESDLGEPQRHSPRPRSSDLFGDAPDAGRGSYGAEDLGNPFESPPNPFDGTPDRPASDQHAMHNGVAADAGEWTQNPPETAPRTGHSVAGEVSGFDPGGTPQDAEAGMSWRDATRRLQELGIDDYHLERGESFDSFLFVCAFEPAGTTNVVMRFEAESDEPLAAVTEVLDQIDRWLRRSFAESRQAALLPNGAAQ